MGYHVSVCLSVALFLVYMVTHGAYQVNCVDLFVCMSVGTSSIVPWTSSMGNHVNQKQRDGQTDVDMGYHVKADSHGSLCKHFYMLKLRLQM